METVVEAALNRQPRDELTADPVALADRFERPLPAGRVVGSTTASGVERRGVDTEGVIGIDNGALRIEPLIRPGWGRAGIAYGPYRRQNGLAFATTLLNGHNISRMTPLPEPLLGRLRQWVRSSGTDRPAQRMVRWLLDGDKRRWWRLVRGWIRDGVPVFRLPTLDENLAVGWFPSQAPSDPLHQGNGIVVRASIPNGGDLLVRHGREAIETARGLQNLPMHYVVVLREVGAAYYAASLPRVPGLAAAPALRLLAIDPFNADETVYAGVHQSVLGETGFRADTRVFGACVASVPELASWYGSAQGADRLDGEGALEQTAPVGGAPWTAIDGRFVRTPRGAVATAAINTAVMTLPAPSGLVHVVIEPHADPVDRIGIVWRHQDADNFWCFEAGTASCRILLRERGRWSEFPAAEGCHLVPNAPNSVQVFDDGWQMRFHVNGDLAYGGGLYDARLSGATGAGICAVRTADAALRGFEAHPREIPVPRQLMPVSLWFEEGTQVAVADDFAGPAGHDLIDRPTAIGGRVWRRSIGSGRIQLTGRDSAVVAASVDRPCPGRTAYTVEWRQPRFADVEATVTPPGLRVGAREKGRAGIVFWQDADHYVILSAFIGDYPAMSIAAFFRIGGVEELYDAVWSNVGRRMQLGIPHNFRVVFDGARFVASVNREPVLYRALRDVYPSCANLDIARVGIVANWEWGNDTGSTFERFLAREKP